LTLGAVRYERVYSGQVPQWPGTSFSESLDSDKIALRHSL